MQSKATTVEQYLAELPEDRRAAISAVRDVILANLDKDYEEGMSYGAIGYYVPHSLYPAGYHCNPKLPLPFAGLGSQKNHMSLGIMCHYYGSAEDKWFRSAWTKAGKKLDMGVCCVRFKKLDDVPLEVVGEAIRRVPAKKFIEFYENARAGAAKAKAARTGKKTVKKKAAGKKKAGKRVAKKERPGGGRRPR